MSGTMMEPMYCSQQIIIPPTFPHVLKVFAKAAIRTQPYDLLLWSADYFKALSEGRVPPVKERLEYPLIRSEGGLSPQYLKILIKQLSSAEQIESESLRKRWTGVCLQESELKEILCTAGVYLTEKFPLYKFAAVAAGFLCKSLTQTMIMLCEIYTDEPDGGSAAISADFFVDLYTFLAAIDARAEVTYFDGYREDVYVANEATKKEIVVEDEEIIIPLIKDSERWIPKLKGWTEESSVWETNLILGEAVPVEGGKVSRNLALLNRAPREKFTDPHAPLPAITTTASEELDTVSPKEEEVKSEEVDVEKAASDTQNPEKRLTEDLDLSKKSEGSVEEVESEGSAPKAEIEEKVEEVEKSAEQIKEPNDLEQQPEEPPTEVKEEEVLMSKETIIDEETARRITEEAEEVEAGIPQLNRDHGVILRVFSEEGEKIESISVASVEDKKSGEGSEGTVEENGEEKPDEKTENIKEERGEEDGTEQEEGSAEGSVKGEEKEEKDEKLVKLDVSVKEREAIIEQLEMNQEKKVNAFMDAIESIEDLAEKTKMLTYDADKIGGKDLTVKSGEIIAEAVEREILIMVQRPEKQDIHADAKGVVNPILGDFFKSFYELVAEPKDTHIPEVIVVPGKLGIGPAVDLSMVEEVVRYVRETGADQGDMFMPRDIRHCLCPPLERNGSIG